MCAYQGPRPLHPTQVEHVADNTAVLEGAQMDNASLEEFKHIFERFAKFADEASGAAADAAEAEAEAAATAAEAEAAARKKAGAEEGADMDTDDDGAGPRLSRKQRKLKSRLSVAELKQLVQRPDVVEAHDVTAADPRMLVFLKVCLAQTAVEPGFTWFGLGDSENTSGVNVSARPCGDVF